MITSRINVSTRFAIIALALLAAFTLPLAASAATITNLSDVGTLIINVITNILVPVLFAIAFIVFLWGAFDAFILGATDGQAKEKGKNLMLWGLIGFFVMISIWGLVNILVGTINFSNNTSPTSVPKADFQSTGV